MEVHITALVTLSLFFVISTAVKASPDWRWGESSDGSRHDSFSFFSASDSRLGSSIFDDDNWGSSGNFFSNSGGTENNGRFGSSMFSNNFGTGRSGQNSFGSSNFFDERSGYVSGTGTANEKKNRRNSLPSRRSSESEADPFSSFDLNSFGGQSSGSEYDNNAGRFGRFSWNNGQGVSTGGAVSSRAVGPNSRVSTSSSSRFDLSSGASSHGSSYRSGNFGESTIDLGIFTENTGGNGRRHRPSNRGFGIGDSFGFGSASGRRIRGEDRGFGSGRLSGSLSSSGASSFSKSFFD